jgi:hypothetical protein
LEADRAVMEGKSPFEFRILDRPPENLFDNVSRVLFPDELLLSFRSRLAKIRVLYQLINDYESVEKKMHAYATNFVELHFNHEKHKDVRKQNKHINFYAETAKFDFKALTLNLNKVFTELHIHCYGLVHWELTESFFHCIPGSVCNRLK